MIPLKMKLAEMWNWEEISVISICSTCQFWFYTFKHKAQDIVVLTCLLNEL